MLAMVVGLLVMTPAYAATDYSSYLVEATQYTGDFDDAGFWDWSNETVKGKVISLEDALLWAKYQNDQTGSSCAVMYNGNDDSGTLDYATDSGTNGTVWWGDNISGSALNGYKIYALSMSTPDGLVPPADVTGVTLDQSSASIVEGDTLTLTATVSPADATDKTLTWSTSDSSVATVEAGAITAISPGTATITATATNGTDDTTDDKSASCSLTVRAMTCSFSFPETPFIQNPGWNELTEGIRASGDIPASKKLVVTASSTNGFKLVSSGGSLSYKFADTGDSSTTYDNATAKTRWEFTADELKGNGTTKPIGIVIEDYTGRLSGSYTGDAQFTGTIE